METKIIKVTSDYTDISEAADLIRRGELVAFPTETVYGLGADALNPDAAGKIYAAKGRPSDNPLIVHIAEFEALDFIVKDMPESARLLSDAFWPGPLTMVMQKKDSVPDTTTGGLDTVAVRMPCHPAALALIRESGCMIAAPSANTSGRPSPTEAEHVMTDLAGKIPMILDGGQVGIGIESTIVDLTGNVPVILRPGYITRENLREALDMEVEIDPAVLTSEKGGKPKAPGMKYKHYAPKADLVIVEGETKSVISKINMLAEEKHNEGLRAGIIATDETKVFYKADEVVSIGARADEDMIARRLYGILRNFDMQNIDVIYSESFATPRIGQAIMNRLIKAAGHQVISV